jgi:hypothetical protein
MATTPLLERWKTMVIDAFGLVAVVWAIPLAIIVVGTPIALLFLGARLIARMIW